MVLAWNMRSRQPAKMGVAKDKESGCPSDTSKNVCKSRQQHSSCVSRNTPRFSAAMYASAYRATGATLTSSMDVKVRDSLSVCMSVSMCLCIYVRVYGQLNY